MYDISNNRSRRWVAKYCKRSGLLRVQKSIFLGQLTKATKDQLIADIQPFVDPKRDRLFVVPFLQSQLDAMLREGTPIDKKRIKREIDCLFF